MQNAIAMGSGLIYGTPTQIRPKRLTQPCINDAIEMCKFYKNSNAFDFSKEDYKAVKKQILSAKSDDEISGILCRLRHRMYAQKGVIIMRRYTYKYSAFWKIKPKKKW